MRMSTQDSFERKVKSSKGSCPSESRTRKGQGRRTSREKGSRRVLLSRVEFSVVESFGTRLVRAVS